MAAFAIMVGTKDGAREAVLIDQPDIVRAAFKEAVKSGSSSFQSIEVIDTRQGRVKRHNFVKAAAQAKPEQGEAASQPESEAASEEADIPKRRK